MFDRRHGWQDGIEVLEPSESVLIVAA
jgi:hypothetical protein